MKQHTVWFMSLALVSLLSFTGVCRADTAPTETPTTSEKTPYAPKGFLAKQSERFFACTRHVDELMTRYTTGEYYRINREKRRVEIVKQLTPTQATEIKRAIKELKKVINLYSTCSPGDYDYMEVKEKYLPLLREMNHQFYTFVMQPLRISHLDSHDHVRKMVAPPAMVLVGIGVILLLDRVGLLPEMFNVSTRSLIIGGVLLASAGIAYNYRSLLLSYSREIEIFKLLDNGSVAGTRSANDLGALMIKEREEEIAALAKDVAGVLQEVVGE